MNHDGKRAVLFATATLATTYLFAAVYYAAGGRIWTQPWFTASAVVYMWIPALVAIALQKLVYKEGVIGPLGVSFRLNFWWLVGWVLPPLAMYLSFGISLFMPGVSLSPDMAGFLDRLQGVMPPEQIGQMREQLRNLPPYIGWLAITFGVIPSMMAGATINAVAAFGEELGWRGFLQRSLAFLGFWRSSFVAGLVWGIWHAPLILQGYNYPQHPIIGVFMMTGLTMLLAPVFAWVAIRSRSVVAAAVAHGTFNAVSGLAFLLVRGGSDLTIGVTGLPGLISLTLINLAIWLYERRLDPSVRLQSGFFAADGE